ncbi:MAG: RecX family transcriptional regulator [Bacilli bacterium]|nr:RecX family transcriptional regulator [Bacilli bacterium]
MKIEKIKKLNNGKYKIELDNKEKITTYEDVILEENILFKKELNNEIINKINIKNDYYKIYSKTLKYIMTKLRSEKEINIYLDKQNIEKKDKEKIIKTLKENRLLNDNNFYISYISDRLRLSNDGPDKIKNDLLNHNIDINKIEEELDKYNDLIYEKLEKLIIKKTKQLNKYSEYILKQKIKEYFINLGYKKDMIEELLNNITIDNDEALKKEYEKQYNKLSKKYKNEELTYKIKNNLYQKGYKLDEINKII